MNQHELNQLLVRKMEKELWEEAEKKREELRKQNERNSLMTGVASNANANVDNAAASGYRPFSGVCGKSKPTHGQKIGTNPHFILTGSTKEVQKLNPICADGSWGFEINSRCLTPPNSPWKNLYSPDGVLGDYMTRLDENGCKVIPKMGTVLEAAVMLQYVNTFPFYLGVFLINMPVDKKIECPTYAYNIAKIVSSYENSHRETRDTISLAGIIPPNSSSGSLDLMFKTKARLNETGELMINGTSMEQKRTWINVTMDKLKDSILCWNYTKGFVVDLDGPVRPKGPLDNMICLILQNSELYKFVISNYKLIVGTAQTFSQNSWQMDVKALLSDQMARKLKLQEEMIVHVVPLSAAIVQAALNLANDHISSLPFANPSAYQICVFRLDSLDWCDFYGPTASSGCTHTVCIEYECKFRIVDGPKSKK